MRAALIFFLFLLIAALGIFFFHGRIFPKNPARPSSPGMLPVDSIHHGAWIFFSRDEFPQDEIVNNLGGKNLRTLKGPYVEHKLSPAELLTLDSTLKGLYNVHEARMDPLLDCYRPRHAVVLFDDKGIAYKWIDICFECNGERAMPANFSNATLKAWKIFFTRFGWPVDGDYRTFFTKAQTDSLFRKGKGTFHF
ncbi:MAG TPA: hypothetical protein VFU15_04665 [Bacteroidia bacterium]|nr:hypothetical protein [Bacteroidia bacterium]